MPVDLRVRRDDGNAHRHEFHDLGAVGFIAKGVRPLGHHPEVRVRHDDGDLAHASPVPGNAAGRSNQFRRQFDQRFLGVAVSVDVEFSVGQLAADLLESPDGDVDALVPLESAWEQDDQPAILLAAPPRQKYTGVHVVDESSAAPRGAGALRIPVQP